MSKKLLSLVGSLLLLSGSLNVNSFAVGCDQPESKIVSEGKEAQSSNEVEKLINGTINLIFELYNVNQNISVGKNGDVYVSVPTIPWKRDGAEEAKVGGKFTIDEEAFKQWIEKDRRMLLDSIQQNSWAIDKRTKQLIKNILKLKKEQAYDEFISAYVESIMGDELSIAKGEVAKLKKSLRFHKGTFMSKFFQK